MRFSVTRMRSASLVALALTQTPAAGGTQEPSLAAVLTQATQYVDELQRELAGVVMEERYEQRSRVPPQYARQIPRIGRVTLLSDYLLVQPRDPNVIWASGMSSQSTDEPFATARNA